MKLDLLAIAAHPDDVELTCGGTLLKAAEQGYRTGIMDVTAGDMGTRGPPDARPREAAGAIRALKPPTVILTYWEGPHPDHYIAARLGYEGCFLAELKQLPIEGEAF